MAVGKRSQPLLLLLLGAALLAAAAAPSPVDAAWTQADPRGVVIQQVARFAIIVYDLGHKHNSGMTYLGLVRGETEQAAGGGVIYHLVVAAAAKPDGSGKAEYDCLVWGVPGSSLGTWNLLRFEKIN